MIDRIRRSRSTGLAVHDKTESVFTIDRNTHAEVAIMTSCPPSVPVPPLRALRERGVTVFAGSDNIRDCWSPFGNGDMLDRAALIAARHEMFTNQELEDALALATQEADKALGNPRRGLHIGAVADLVCRLLLEKKK